MAKKEKAKTGRRETKRVRVEGKNGDSVEDETHAKLREDSLTNKMIKSQRKKKRTAVALKNIVIASVQGNLDALLSSHLISFRCFVFLFSTSFFFIFTWKECLQQK